MAPANPAARRARRRQLAADFDLHDDCAFQEFCEFSQPLVASGLLAPGLYTLTARSYAELDTEPGTLTLLGYGVAFVSAAARRRHRATESARSSR